MFLKMKKKNQISTFQHSMHINGYKFWVTWVTEQNFSVPFVRELFYICFDRDSINDRNLSYMQQRQGSNTIQRSSYFSPLLNRTSFGERKRLASIDRLCRDKLVNVKCYSVFSLT